MGLRGLRERIRNGVRIKWSAVGEGDTAPEHEAHRASLVPLPMSGKRRRDCEIGRKPYERLADPGVERIAAEPCAIESERKLIRTISDDKGTSLSARVTPRTGAADEEERKKKSLHVRRFYRTRPQVWITGQRPGLAGAYRDVRGVRCVWSNTTLRIASR
ncbi:MAG: hypothetical protein NVS4B3_18510 [Gemmatimonadaceae bacterium]